MNNYFFTFGTNHLDNSGQTLANRFVKIRAKNWQDARDEMFKVRGNVWSFQYEEIDFKPQIKKYNLVRVSLSEINLKRKEV